MGALRVDEGEEGGGSGLACRCSPRASARSLQLLLLPSSSGSAALVTGDAASGLPARSLNGPGAESTAILARPANSGSVPTGIRGTITIVKSPCAPQLRFEYAISARGWGAVAPAAAGMPTVVAT